MNKLENFKNSLFEKACIGIFSKTIDSNLVEAAGYSGLGFIILDMEHGPATIETLHNHVRAAVCSNMFPIIRVKGVDANAIGSALDCGALGVQIPNIATAEQARFAVNSARFYPKGMRGVCRFVKAANFGSMDKADYFESANSSLLILQVEGLEGINNLDEILEVEGFDVLFIGPYDLSQSIGKPGEVDSVEVIDLMLKIAHKVKQKGLVLGTFSDNLQRNLSLKNQGFNYIAYSVDMNIFSNALSSIIKGF
ncbi:MAG: aldolase [Methylovulum sp.]|jgi:4-hydroxy-2-oxoheptanedioate aldolase|nr:aldolase [Methylovulum sp.]MCF8000044.1 aldolase [Methylovulum sp.]MCF8007676.1 aldolase [Methylovulum sp.]